LLVVAILTYEYICSIRGPQSQSQFISPPGPLAPLNFGIPYPKINPAYAHVRNFITLFFRFGYSPLHLAALNEYSYCANMLLAYGADITARTNGGSSALAMIVRKIPNVLPKFEDMLDHAITLAEHDINDVDCELKLDFRVLIPNQSRGN
jgi:ankyrin repeat protein